MDEEILPHDVMLAAMLYSRYCEAVGGKAFNGTDLPTWKDFYRDPEKQIQVRAWIRVAQKAQEEILVVSSPNNDAPHSSVATSGIEPKAAI